MYSLMWIGPLLMAWWIDLLVRIIPVASSENNMVYMTPGTYSANRRAGSDALIIVWDSPQTQVLHNSILNQ